MSDKLAAPLTSEEFEQLDELLFSYANKGDEDAILLNVSELDGFLTAILSSVNVLAMTDWLPILFNNDVPNLEDKRSKQFIELVSRHYNSLAQTLLNDKKEYHPIFWEERVGRRKLVVVSPWCGGYIVGTMAASWQNLSAEIQPHFELIEQHAKSSYVEQMPPLEEQRKIEKAIRNAALAVFEQVNEVAPLLEKPQPYVNQNKVGVNEPCPCGSGKKYKKCCMNK
ncbi:UPF0149 family protein [Actinobacillus equuli subsp. equuli]|uniref:UPF0149 family protein n=1 Tax=Actinobacillus equuli TaxID=718 RepID=UPI0024425FDE|nr:UPF0149 family protein [Actinobacillus equuli]WGE55218.1 UPF0149 family protein [Actinobacillus equuli subsp. equuli]